MSADNAIFVKKWAGKFHVWHDFMSIWEEKTTHKPPKSAQIFGNSVEAEEHARLLNSDYQTEYGIIIEN
jgi:hypothetical protein